MISFKAKATTPDGSELELDTGNLDEAKRWCDRWVADGRRNVRVTVLRGELWGPQTSRTYRWVHDSRQLGSEIR